MPEVYWLCNSTAWFPVQSKAVPVQRVNEVPLGSLTVQRYCTGLPGQAQAVPSLKSICPVGSVGPRKSSDSDAEKNYEL